jgi:hypothetical protein
MRKSEEVKARVEPLTRLGLEEIARNEHLDLSDIVRRALREYMERRAYCGTIRADAEAKR